MFLFFIEPIISIGKICIRFDIYYKYRIQYNFHSVKWSKVVVKDNETMGQDISMSWTL